jgi:hypothetical protein
MAILSPNQLQRRTLTTSAAKNICATRPFEHSLASDPRSIASSRLSGNACGALLLELYRCVPAASGTVTTWELSTPLFTQHFANAPQGEMYGLAHMPARFESRDLRPHTPIRNLFSDRARYRDAGVMGALSGAVVTASAMLRRNMFGEVSKAARRRARLNSGSVPGSWTTALAATSAGTKGPDDRPV